jgi:preprotein translocase subunit SecG
MKAHFQAQQTFQIVGYWINDQVRDGAVGVQGCLVTAAARAAASRLLKTTRISVARLFVNVVVLSLLSCKTSRSIHSKKKHRQED